mgnify:CR=1 FL=1
MNSALLQSDNFLQLISKHLPDMLWAKDLEGYYLYANESICNNLLMATPDEVLGKCDVFFATRERNKHPENKNWHTFGELCFNSDYVVLENMKPMKFKEYGNIRGELVYLEVHKAPLHDANGKLIGTIGSGRNITAQVLLEEQNEKLAYYDQLTGLGNRQKIFVDISRKNPIACAIFNIDDFKEINDFFGTENGDQILKDISQWFSKLDFETYRVDGDEFAILYYEDISLERIEHNIKNILALFEEELFHIQNEKIQITFSVGIAKEKLNLFTKADIALHHSKENKSRVSTYKENANIEKKYKQNIAMATSIREALMNNRIICHYQPIVNASTNEIDKYETLVRMIDKNGLIIPPIEFLDISKKTKLYSHITLEVINQACNTFENRSENFSVNLSIDDIKDPNTVYEIVKAITTTKTASRIIFEILESEGIENYKEVSDFIIKMKALGAKIAIDDFGTGYSSLSYLKQLPINQLKIDQGFVRDIINSSNDRAIAQAVITLADSMELQVIAEGVETEAQRALLQSMGCHTYQGYLYGKPCRIEELHF